ncbi:hypothetical protein J6590_036781 [Homalodisca vitripennis]|nr:hypothetical protein J6590_036781 [Homalodisca vitripennis]
MALTNRGQPGILSVLVKEQVIKWRNAWNNWGRVGRTGGVAFGYRFLPPLEVEPTLHERLDVGVVGGGHTQRCHSYSTSGVPSPVYCSFIYSNQLNFELSSDGRASQL